MSATSLLLCDLKQISEMTAVHKDLLYAFICGLRFRLRSEVRIIIRSIETGEEEESKCSYKLCSKDPSKLRFDNAEVKTLVGRQGSYVARILLRLDVVNIEEVPLPLQIVNRAGKRVGTISGIYGKKFLWGSVDKWYDLEDFIVTDRYKKHLYAELYVSRLVL